MTTPGRYTALDTVQRRIIREMVRDAIGRNQRPDALAPVYAELALRSFMMLGIVDPFWLRCYELCDRLSMVQTFARIKSRR